MTLSKIMEKYSEFLDSIYAQYSSFIEKLKDIETKISELNFSTNHTSRYKTRKTNILNLRYEEIKKKAENFIYQKILNLESWLLKSQSDVKNTENEILLSQKNALSI